LHPEGKHQPQRLVLGSEVERGKLPDQQSPGLLHGSKHQRGDDDDDVLLRVVFDRSLGPADGLHLRSYSRNLVDEPVSKEASPCFSHVDTVLS
jgi:hypothetical protein